MCDGRRSLVAVCLAILIMGVPCSLAAASTQPNTPWGDEICQQIKQPFLRNVIFQNLTPNQSSASGSFRIPAGKRLVIEFVTLYGFAPIAISSGSGMELGGPSLVHLFINSTVGGYSGTDAVLAAGRTSLHQGLNYWDLVKSLRIYADPGKPVTVKIQALSQFGANAYFLVTISGYLVDVPKTQDIGRPGGSGIRTPLKPAKKRE